MTGLTRTVKFVSLWTKDHHSGDRTSTDEYVYRAPGLDDGQPAKGFLYSGKTKMYSYSNICGWDAVITDVVGNRSGANPFQFKRWKNAFLMLTGSTYYAPTQSTWHAIDVCCGQGYSLADPAVVFPPLTAGQKIAMVNEVISRTNPSAPVISLPTFLAELREVPETLLTYGEKLLTAVRKASYLTRWRNAKSFSQLFADRVASSSKRTKSSSKRNLIPTWDDVWSMMRGSLNEAAEANLAYRWGVLPFVSDIVKILKFQKSVNARLRRFDRLYRKGSFTSRCTLPARTEVTSVSPNRILLSAGPEPFTVGQLVQRSRERVWGSARWRIPDTKHPPSWLLTEPSRASMAERIVGGLTNYEALQTLWEITPNSWLSDWFFGIGDFIKANNNTLNLIVDTVCLMRHLRTDSKWVLIQTPKGFQSTLAAPGFFEWKLREVGLLPVVFPTFGVPLLTKGQWSIVASIVAGNSKR